ncbi:CHAP domain-containing protein [Bifidobacterium sp. ESL0745]|uniref:CHAP domain-containing protein n=1 Tax=Bifidobacterium sp. ESL0745 TaxID=2983226 RepID=UPI0032AF3E19
MLKATRRIRALIGSVFAIAMLSTCVTAGLTFGVAPARAVTSQDYQRKQQETNNLKAQLAGVSSTLASKIIELDDLNNNQLPAAQQSADDAQNNASQAQDAAKAASDRLDAAIKDKDDLEAQIKQTGMDYDDAKAGVAQVARDSFHASQATQVMDVVTKSSTTQDFVDKMQSQAAVKRSEANAADEDANTLNSSQNRKQRLEAIEQQISKLKVEADNQAASAQQAAQDAQAKQASLQDLLNKGMSERDDLESQKGELTTQSARNAAELVTMQAQIHAQMASAVAATSNNYDPRANGQQGSHVYNKPSVSRPSAPAYQPPAPVYQPSAPVSASGMNYSVPGNCWGVQGFCYGHPTGDSGNAYPSRQCTLWAYLRRHQLGLPAGSYMGNGGSWGDTGRRLGYLVNNTPHVGAAVVFRPGQAIPSMTRGTWHANAACGHVAVVEAVGNGYIMISEGGVGFGANQGFMEPVSNPGAYEYVHY